MRREILPVRFGCALALALSIVNAGLAQSTPNIIDRVGQAFRHVGYVGTEPSSSKDCVVEQLAENIDWLEHHLDTFGSIVAKQPDIWGEARLTKHRDEYEQILFQELNQFTFRINATIEQSDSSFLAQSLALSAAAAGQPPSVPPLADATPEAADAAEVDLTKFGTGDKIDIEPTIFLDQLSRYLQHLHELRRINEGDDTSDSPGYSLNLVRVPVSVLPGKYTRKGYGGEITLSAEPVLTADLLPTTFRNLVANDLVAQLGLPLVRITEGYPELEHEYYSQESLRLHVNETKRIANGLRYELEQLHRLRGVEREDPKLKPGAKQQFQVYMSKLQNHLKAISASPALTRQDLKKIDDYLGEVVRIKAREAISPANIESIINDTLSITDMAPLQGMSERVRNLAAIAAVPSGRTRQAKHPVPPSQVAAVYGWKEMMTVAKYFCQFYSSRHVRWNGKPCCKCDNDDVSKPCTRRNCNRDSRVNLIDARKFLQSEIDAAYELLAEPHHLDLWYRLARPHSGLATAVRSGHLSAADYGLNSVENFRELFFYTLHRTPFEDDEVTTQFLEQQELPLAPRTRRLVTANNPVEALAWAVVVESALLNQRLNEDVRKIAVAKQCCDLQLERELAFFLPESVMRPVQHAGSVMLPQASEQLEIHVEVAETQSFLQEEYQLASEVFRNYVRCRWPIHVFALDPVAQDQNVADASKRKRELQFALSLAFVTGQIGGNSLTQFSRDLQTEVNTIALNRTTAGFAHGPNTFGWRFYPRVQGLDVPGTVGSIWQTIRGTPRDADIRQRSIEPGMRECIAIVLMPSFVPYVDMHVRSNWFKLTYPRKTALTMKDTVRYSRAITSMRALQAKCQAHAHRYRPNEVHRMMHRVNQLDRELPLQSMRVQVPYENTLGGFEMFNMGVTDLSPELIGWHGAPGILVDASPTNQYNCGCTAACNNGSRSFATTCEKSNKALPPPICEGAGTSLFLVGDNFSVHDTRVIAGGVCIPHVQLISRQIMRVTIPSCVNLVCIDDEEYVDIHVATPYGVTNHLHVPVQRRGAKKCLPEQVDPMPAPPSDGPSAEHLEQPELHPARLTPDDRVGAAPIGLKPLNSTRVVRLPPAFGMPAVRSVRRNNAKIATQAVAQSPLSMPRNFQPTRLIRLQEDDGDEDGNGDDNGEAKPPIQVQILPVEVKLVDEAKASNKRQKSFPMLKRMNTQFRENWRNVRDQLPFN